MAGMDETSQKRPFQFSLGCLLFGIIFLSIYLGVDKATAGMRPLNDTAGGAVIWSAIGIWFFLRGVKRRRQADVERRRKLDKIRLDDLDLSN
jgi:hypothetical protein